MLKFSISLLSVFWGLLLITQPAVASGIQFDVDISESYQITENYLERQTIENIRNRHFVRDRSYNLVNVRPSVSIFAGKGFSAYLGADVFWENPVEEDVEDEVTADVTTAYLSLKGHNISADIGLQPVEFGNAFILVDDALAAAVHINDGDVYAGFKAAQVMDESIIAGLSLGYRPGYFERLEIFGAWYRDQDDAFANSAPLESHLWLDLSSEGDIYYLGAAADLFVGDALFSMVAAYQTGRVTISSVDILDNTEEHRYDFHAFFGDISIQKNFAELWSVELFCFAASGDKQDQSNDLDAFVSVVSYNPRADIFFDLSFLSNDDAESVIYGSGYFWGVIAPGLSLYLELGNGFSAEVSLITMYAQHELDDGSQWYGWEVDLGLGYAINENFSLQVEAARFEHGDYFESMLNEAIDPATRLILGLRATF